MKRLHLATANDEATARAWAERLRAAGIDAWVEPGDGSPDPPPGRWRVLAPEDRWLDARRELGADADQEMD